MDIPARPRSTRHPALAPAFLALLLATASCRQILGIVDRPAPCNDPLMIDDMEDDDVFICESAGRHGAWFSFGDGTPGATVTPGIPFKPTAITDGTRSASRYAARFTGSGFTDWGALMGLSFKNDVQGLGRNTYDATNTGGLTFWMKSNAPVTVQLLIPETVLKANGGDCADTATARNCDNPFAFTITAPGDGWKEYEVPFNALTQSGSATWDPSQLLGIQFLVGPGVTFDTWVDDLAFYYCATPECVPTCTDPKRAKACPAHGNHGAACFPTETDCAAIDTWCTDPMLVDDMEDGDGAICNTGGRQGSWYTYGDGGPPALFEQALIPGGRSGSHYAAHLVASGLTGWGAGMGATLQALGREPYDATTVDGVTFWIRSNAFVNLQLRTIETTPVANAPGTCTNDWDCDHHFSFTIPQTGDQWIELHVPFTAVRQGQSGSATWDPAHLLAIEFSAMSPNPDLWVDDLRFYKCDGDACVPTCTDPGLPVACPASGGLHAACWPAGTDCANPPDFDYLTGIWGSGPDDVWMAGFSWSTWAGKTLHWDGFGWTSVVRDGAPAIWGLWGSDPDDVWTVGVRGTIERRAGAQWLAETSGTTATLYQGLWGSGPTDVWAAGAKGTIVHWNGTEWSPVPSQTTQDLWGVWSSARDDAWAVGVGGTTLRWNGSTWAAVASGTSQQLDGVWGSGRDDVWAVGDQGTILRWDGSIWQLVPTGTTKYLDGVWGSGPNDVWVVGDAGTVLRWDGSAWNDVPSGTTQYLDGVWGSGPDDVWIVGDQSTVLHWDGMRLSPVAIDQQAR